MHDSDEALTVAEIATICQVAHTTVRNWIREGKLTAYALPGGHYRVTRATLTQFMSKFSIPFPRSLAREADGSPLKMLVIDDDIPFCRLLQEWYRDEEFDVSVANNGIEGIMLAGSLRPDVIILDALMPGVNGIETCKAIRAIAELSRAIILIVTGRKNSPEAAAAVEAGANACLFKPVGPDVILRTINEFRDNRAAQDGARGRI